MQARNALTLAALGALALVGAVAYMLVSVYTAGPPQCSPEQDCAVMAQIGTSLAVGELLFGLPGFAGLVLLRSRPRIASALLALGGLLLLAPAAFIGAWVLVPAALLWLAAATLGFLPSKPAPQVRFERVPR